MQAELAYFSQSCRPEAFVCATQRHERNNLFLEAVVSERLADAAAVVMLEIHKSVVKVAAARAAAVHWCALFTHVADSASGWSASAFAILFAPLQYSASEDASKAAAPNSPDSMLRRIVSTFSSSNATRSSRPSFVTIPIPLVCDHGGKIDFTPPQVVGFPRPP